nr:replication initiation protein [Enterococcus ureasiticus]
MSLESGQYECYLFFLEEFVSLKKKYSKNLYRILKQFEKKGYWEVPIETLTFLLGIPKNYQVG